MQADDDAGGGVGAGVGAGASAAYDDSTVREAEQRAARRRQAELEELDRQAELDAEDSDGDGTAARLRRWREREAAKAARGASGDGDESPKSLEEMQKALKDKKALLEDMRKWNDRLGTVVKYLLIPLALVMLYALVRGQLLAWCTTSHDVFFKRLAPNVCAQMRLWYPDAFNTTDTTGGSDHGEL